MQYNMLDVITFGETMVLFSPEENGPIRHIHKFSKSIAGAESNVAIALARLGHQVAWFSKVGDDGFGEYIQVKIRGEGVDVSSIVKDKENPTGLLFKEIFEHVNTNVYYYRKNSAASYLNKDDINPEVIKKAKILHLTGITPALSESAKEAVYEAIRIAKENNVIISFDPNIRLKLWSLEEAKPVLLHIISQSDILFPGIDEGELLLGISEENDIIRQFHEMGPQVIALKLGKRGCKVSDGQEISFVSGYPVENIKDSVGAGDGFAAGFLSSYLKGYELEICGDYANGVGAMATLVKGDSEGYPTLKQLLAFTHKEKHIDR